MPITCTLSPRYYDVAYKEYSPKENTLLRTLDFFDSENGWREMGHGEKKKRGGKSTRASLLGSSPCPRIAANTRLTSSGNFMKLQFENR